MKRLLFLGLETNVRNIVKMDDGASAPSTHGHLALPPHRGVMLSVNFASSTHTSERNMHDVRPQGQDDRDERVVVKTASSLVSRT